MVLQDGTELCISNARISEEWRECMLSAKKSIKAESLEVHRYGCWKIGERNEVEKLTRVLLALALRATAEDRD